MYDITALSAPKFVVVRDLDWNRKSFLTEYNHTKLQNVSKREQLIANIRFVSYEAKQNKLLFEDAIFIRKYSKDLKQAARYLGSKMPVMSKLEGQMKASIDEFYRTTMEQFMARMWMSHRKAL